MIRVVICDTFPVLLTGLTDILRDAQDIRVIASCTSGAEALTVVRTQDPDILITDLWLGDTSGLELAQTIADLMGKELKYTVVDVHTSRPGHDRHYGLDGTKLRNLGWVSPVSFEDSMKATIEWQRANPEWLS